MEEENKTTEQHELDLGIGTLYDVNKTLVEKQEKKLSEGILNSKKEIVKNFIEKTNNVYYMLLSNERKDYTIFKLTSKDNSMELSKCLIDECLFNRGEIRGIDITQDKGAIEIWMIIDNEAYVYYFFPYDAALVEI